MFQLDALNEMDEGDFARALAPVFEGAAWVARAAAGLRPFPTVTALHQALFDAVLEAPAEAQVDFLCTHPDLAGPAARQRTMGAHSTTEQASLGLDRLDEAGAARFAAMNSAYRARFGFPFMLCVRRHSRASVLRQFARRLAADPATERAAALAEVFRITRLRIVGLVEGRGMPEASGLLSTHVLDTAAGGAAAGVKIELFAWEDSGPERVRTAVTDAEGRVPGGLLAGPEPGGGPLRIGVYELRFHVGAYFAAAGVAGTEPAFLDVVPVRIGISDAEGFYHVPLLVSPWSYTVHRGG